MKTKLFLFAALLITTITYSQTSKFSKKGYDYYKAQSDTKTNKAELVDAITKDAGNYKKRTTKIRNAEKQSAKMQSNPYFVDSALQGEMMIQSGNNSNVELKNTGNQEIEQTKDIHVRKRPGGTKYKNSTRNKVETSNNNLRKKPGRTKATDYNSSRSNRTTNN